MNINDYQEDYLYSEDYEASMEHKKNRELEKWLIGYFKGEIYE